MKIASHFRAVQPANTIYGGLKDEKFPVFSLIIRECGESILGDFPSPPPLVIDL